VAAVLVILAAPPLMAVVPVRAFVTIAPPLVAVSAIPTVASVLTSAAPVVAVMPIIAIPPLGTVSLRAVAVVLARRVSAAFTLALPLAGCRRHNRRTSCLGAGTVPVLKCSRPDLRGLLGIRSDSQGRRLAFLLHLLCDVQWDVNRIRLALSVARR
jgi:hypothetical protein